MNRMWTLGAVAGLALAMGCSNNVAPDGARLSLTIATPAQPTAARSGLPAAAADTLGDSVNTLIVTSVQLVLREVELDPVEAGDSAPDSTHREEFEAGPLRLDLPLGGGADQMVSVAVTPGSYDKIEFEIHTVSSDDPAEADFRAANPELVGASIRVQGSFNGTAFTYTTDMDQEQEAEITPPLVVDETGATANLTLRVDPRGWFLDHGGSLVDPATANHGGPNESLVESNIERSFEAFEDEDHDGAED